MAIDKTIYLNVFRNETPSQKAPTHSWNNFELKETITIPAGTYDLSFWGNAVNPKTGKDNPHFKISNPFKKDKDKIPF